MTKSKGFSRQNEPEQCERCGCKDFRFELGLGGKDYYQCVKCGQTFYPDTLADKAIAATWKKGVKFQFWWLGFLFRNPDLYLLVVCWALTVLFIAGAQRNASLISTVVEWVVGSIFLSIAPVLTLLYVRRKRSGLSMIRGWTQAWKTSLRPASYTVVGMAVLFLAILATRPAVA